MFLLHFFFAIINFMEVKRASVLGFCFGVRRAVEYAEKALEDYSGKKVYSLGPLLHNEIVLQNLKDKGLEILSEDDLDRVEPQSVVIIRAHGVSPSITKILEDKNCTIINATCPRVNANQITVQKASAKGKTIILTGDSNHGEVKGIAGYAEGEFILLQNEEDARALKEGSGEAVLLSQTTFSPVQFEKISEIVGQKYKNLKINNTICPATKERQDSLVELCKNVDGVLVVGGKNSANTIRLFQTAQKNCAHAAHIQSAEEIPQEFFAFKRVHV